MTKLRGKASDPHMQAALNASGMAAFWSPDEELEIEIGGEPERIGAKTVRVPAIKVRVVGAKAVEFDVTYEDGDFTLSPGLMVSKLKPTPLPIPCRLCPHIADDSVALFHHVKAEHPSHLVAIVTD